MRRPDHIPLELLQTFVSIADLEGDATTAARELGISQPTISKRLSALRRVTTEPDGQPWLLLKGKRWKVTPEGQRVRGVVTELVRRYAQVEQFIAGNQPERPVVSIACGQQAVTSFVKTAIRKLLQESPDCRVRLSTPRGKARIDGVAGGQFDIAIVTDSPATINRIARTELYIESLFEDRFVLAANPPPRADWGKTWKGLSDDQPVSSKELIGLPFILPEADSSRRQQFDEWSYKATGQLLEAVLETGGWQTILDYVNEGLGLGLVPQSALDEFQSRNPSRLTTRPLNARDFPPEAVRFIARKMHGKNLPELQPLGNSFWKILAEYVSKE